MKASLTALVLFLGIGPAAAAEMDKPRLRQLAGLPKVRGELVVTFSQSRGLHFNEPQRPAAEELAWLKKQLGSDPEAYLRLGDFLSRQGDRQEADRIYTRAVVLCRRRVQDHPENNRYLAQLGDALLRTEHSTEGRALIERAVKKAPNDWYVWLTRAKGLDSRAYQKILKNPFHFRCDTRLAGNSVFLKGKPTAAQIAEIERLHKEARRCFDRAITLAPREVKPRQARLGSTILYKLVDNRLHSASGKKVSWTDAILSLEAAGEERGIARLCPDDPGVIGAAMLLDFLACVRHDKLEAKSFPESITDFMDKGDRGILDLMPASSRDFFLWGQGRLEQMAQSPTPGGPVPLCRIEALRSREQPPQRSTPGVAAAASEALAFQLWILTESNRKNPFSFSLLREDEATMKILEHLRRAVQQLRELHLRNARITDAGIVHLKGFTHLRVLDLSGSSLPFDPVLNKGLAVLKNLTKLEELSLDGQPIDDEGLLQLSGLDHLRSLHLRDTNVSSKGIAQLRKRLPELRVSH